MDRMVCIWVSKYAVVSFGNSPFWHLMNAGMQNSPYVDSWFISLRLIITVLNDNMHSGTSDLWFLTLKRPVGLIHESWYHSPLNSALQLSKIALNWINLSDLILACKTCVLYNSEKSHKCSTVVWLSLKMKNPPHKTLLNTMTNIAMMWKLGVCSSLFEQHRRVSITLHKRHQVHF